MSTDRGDDDPMSALTVGTRVQRLVTNGRGERVVINEGVITERVNAEVFRVDIGSLHGAAPWFVLDAAHDLREVRS